MDIRQNVLLKNFTTMKLGGRARFWFDAWSVDDLRKICRDARQKKIPILILGGGSNIIIKDTGFDGIVVRLRTSSIKKISEDETSAIIEAEAGAAWDDLVAYSVEELNLSGIEAMSGVPGTVGAGPVQNIGCYGQEIANTLESVEVLDVENDAIKTFLAKDCQFSYRDSIFKKAGCEKYIILSATLKLYKRLPQGPFYDSLENYLAEHRITNPSCKIIRQSVLAIRSIKLPDPKVLPNSGSFFKNPIIDKWLRDELLQEFPSMPNFEMADKMYKIPAGWLIDQAGLKGKLFNGMRVYEKNALILVNESATGYEDLAAARQAIISAVLAKFRISLEQEPIEV